MLKSRNGENPRSVALVGPQGSGKSTLFDALIQTAGTQTAGAETAAAAVKRPPGPRDRPATTAIRTGHCTYLDEAWSILDCPGSIEFAHEVHAAIMAVDIAVVVCEPDPARAGTIAPLLRMLKDEGVPHFILINKIDTLDGPASAIIAALQEHAASPLVARQMPIFESGHVTGYVDLMSERAYRYRKGQASELIRIPDALRAEEAAGRGRLVETLADHDDALLEKILEDINPTPEELYLDMRKDLLAGAVSEVLLGAGEASHGVRRLWKALRHETPTAAETLARKGIDAEGPALAQVFRTEYAGHTGKLSHARVWRGEIREGMTLGGVRLGGIHHCLNGELSKSPLAVAGDIVALGRLEGVATGMTIAPGAVADPLPFPAPPTPVYALAVTTADRKDDVRLSEALRKLAEEDASLTITQDQETGETVMHGQGEMHLLNAIEHMAKHYNLKMTTRRPAIAYRETIRRAVHEHGRLKRQTGGHGQFADVKIDITPRERGAGFVFVDKIVGGAVPRNFIPSVGEAAGEAARKGPLGHPVVDIEVRLVDGGFHAVDSSDMAFRTATHIAMREGLAKADPVLLEPIDRVTISVPNDHTARAQRLLTGRRGQILGFSERPDWAGWDDVEALVPEAELHDLIIDLRSQTQGLGTFRRRFDHLAEARVPAKV